MTQTIIALVVALQFLFGSAKALVPSHHNAPPVVAPMDANPVGPV